MMMRETPIFHMRRAAAIDFTPLSTQFLARIGLLEYIHWLAAPRIVIVAAAATWLIIKSGRAGRISRFQMPPAAFVDAYSA